MPNPVGNPNAAEAGKPYRFQKGVPNPFSRGRPKLVSDIVDLVKKLNLDPLTPAQVKNSLQSLVVLSVDQLKDIVRDDKQPAFVHIIAKYLVSDKRAYQTIQDILDRTHGKPTQQIQHTGKDGEQLTINLNNFTSDDLRRFIEAAPVTTIPIEAGNSAGSTQGAE